MNFKSFDDVIEIGKANPPELKKFMDKRCQLKLNGNRTVIGVLRGFDPFMNLVIDEAYEAIKTGEKTSDWHGGCTRK